MLKNAQKNHRKGFLAFFFFFSQFLTVTNAVITAFRRDMKAGGRVLVVVVCWGFFNLTNMQRYLREKGIK